MNEYIQNILDYSWQGLALLDSKGNFLYANKAFSPILGYSLDELIDKNINDIILDDDFSFESLKNKDVYHTQLSMLRKDKAKVFLDISFTYVQKDDTFVINAKDITGNIAYDKIIEDFTIYAKVDNDKKIVEVSKKLCNLTGYEKNELIGQKYEILVKDKNTFLEKFSLKEQRFKISCKTKDNKIFWLENIIRPNINKYGDIKGYHILSFDITDSIKLAKANKNLEEKIKEAVEKNRKKDQMIFNQSKLAIMGEMLTTMSHHWRQPLNTISLKAQNLIIKYEFNDNVDKEEAINILNEIEKESDNLSNILQEFQKSISVKEHVIKKNIETILTEAMQIIQNNPLNTKVNFFQNFFDVSKKEVFPADFVNVLVNIMINSLEAFKRNNTKDPVIDLNLSCDDEYAYIEIIDNGGGIEEEILPKIFEPYFSTKEEKNGTGLGLYMAKNIIELKMSGTIEISTISNHAKVFIQIPLNTEVKDDNNSM